MKNVSLNFFILEVYLASMTYTGREVFARPVTLFGYHSVDTGYSVIFNSL